MLKLVLSIVMGAVIAIAITVATDALFHAMSATPVPADVADPAAMGAYLAALPATALIAIVFGWTLSAFAGSAFAARFGGRGRWPGWVVAGLFLLATAANFLMLPHPVWMVVLAVVAIVAAGWLGPRVATPAAESP